MGSAKDTPTVLEHDELKPFQRLAMGMGPSTGAPVVLSKTAKERFTVSTTWVAPTAELGSGGAKANGKAPCGPVKPVPRPSRFKPGTVASVVLGLACSTGSTCRTTRAGPSKVGSSSSGSPCSPESD